ncbi:MAG TPA: DUF134 domain-containing protein [Candidatus Limiplasma sp.]|nr:DUF134 domain-containing protein [Candidatus Limiplasma sp.]HPS82062.1 DUF134 domain-containing protein [Candidatus Limiplasma sp.]
MPRPRKCRMVCCLPRYREFLPTANKSADQPPVYLTVDEYEAVRLIDYENLSQEECAASMEIARTTAQQIYSIARHKIAHALVEGVALRIEGGDYRLYHDENARRGCGSGCGRRPCRRCENADVDKDAVETL